MENVLPVGTARVLTHHFSGVEGHRYPGLKDKFFCIAPLEYRAYKFSTLNLHMSGFHVLAKLADRYVVVKQIGKSRQNHCGDARNCRR